MVIDASSTSLVAGYPSADYRGLGGARQLEFRSSCPPRRTDTPRNGRAFPAFSAGAASGKLLPMGRTFTGRDAVTERYVTNVPAPLGAQGPCRRPLLPAYEDRRGPGRNSQLSMRVQAITPGSSAGRVMRRRVDVVARWGGIINGQPAFGATVRSKLQRSSRRFSKVDEPPKHWSHENQQTLLTFTPACASSAPSSFL